MNLIDAWENMEFLIHEVSVQPDQFDVLARIALYSNHSKSWRAAWIMDKIHEKNKAMVVPYIPSIIDQMKTEKQEGKKRHFLKLISLNSIPEKEQAFLLDYCIDTFTSGKTAIAVRVHAMQVLYEISVNEPALKPEIIAIIEHELEEHSTPGLTSRGEKIIRKLRIQISNS